MDIKCENPSGFGKTCGLDLGHPAGPWDRHIALEDGGHGFKIGVSQWPRDIDGEWVRAVNGRFYPLRFLLAGHEPEPRR